jgi:hypothetical protein
LLFLVSHALLIAFLLLCVACGVKTDRADAVRWMLWLLYIFLLLSFAMYLCVHFLDRYVAGQFWIAFIATAGLLVTKDWRRGRLVEGAAAFLAIAVLLVGLQSVVQMRQRVVLEGIGRGWNNPTEFDAARVLRADGVMPGDSVACFRACNHGAYWARLAGVHVNSEIFDPAYMSDSTPGNESWSRLPNKIEALQALHSTGAKALVGYFESPPAAGGKWRPLAGGYYFIPFSSGHSAIP